MTRAIYASGAVTLGAIEMQNMGWYGTQYSHALGNIIYYPYSIATAGGGGWM